MTRTATVALLGLELEDDDFLVTIVEVDMGAHRGSFDDRRPDPCFTGAANEQDLVDGDVGSGLGGEPLDRNPVAMTAYLTSAPALVVAACSVIAINPASSARLARSVLTAGPGERSCQARVRSLQRNQHPRTCAICTQNGAHTAPRHESIAHWSLEPVRFSTWRNPRFRAHFRNGKHGALAASAVAAGMNLSHWMT